jgi:hypothetical protein
MSKQLNLDHMACIAEQQSPNPYRKEREGKTFKDIKGCPGREMARRWS